MQEPLYEVEVLWVSYEVKQGIMFSVCVGVVVRVREFLSLHWRNSWKWGFCVRDPERILTQEPAFLLALRVPGKSVCWHASALESSKNHREIAQWAVVLKAI